MQKSKLKICRAIGERVYLKCEKLPTLMPIVRKKGRRRKNVSEFKTQLKEKQKLKFSYGLREKQLKHDFKKNPKKLMETLERRLDNVIYRLGLAGSRNIARQIISHGHVFVNNKRVDISSYKVKINDEIKMDNAGAELKEILKKFEPLPWLSLNKEKLEGKIVGLPNISELERAHNVQLVTEFYSK